MMPPILWDYLKKSFGRDPGPGMPSREFDLRLPKRFVREVLDRHDLAYHESGDYWWFYASYLGQHNSTDVLASALLRFLSTKVNRDALIFESGCGCGWFLIGLAQLGFTRLAGSDILMNAIEAASELAKKGGYTIDVWQDNGFAPKRVPLNCDVIIATQWLYSAWAGNYSEVNEGLKEENHFQLLHDFIKTYAPYIRKDGYLIFSLVDSIANFRPNDSGIYPVRHSFEDVKKCLDEFGFTLEERYLDPGDYQPRMAYIAKKTG